MIGIALNIETVDGKPPKFELGQCVTTATIDAEVRQCIGPECQRARHEILGAIARFLKGEWGKLEAEDVAQNERDLAATNKDPEAFGRLMGVYELLGSPLWIITDIAPGQRTTTLLRPSDY